MCRGLGAEVLGRVTKEGGGRTHGCWEMDGIGSWEKSGDWD